MAVFITYDDKKAEVVGQRYVGNGEHAPIWEETPIRKRVRWCNSETAEDMAQAEKYAKREMSDRPGLRVEIIPD